jgi:hypothetical protein
MQQPNQQHSIFDDMKAAGGIGQMLFHAYASVIQAFIRHRFGSRYFGPCESIGVIIPIIPTLGYVAPIPMTHVILPCLAPVYAFLMLWHRVNAIGASKKVRMHSRYNGYPLLCHVLPFSEDVTKRRIEPIAVAMLGFFLLPVDPSLALFVMFGGFVLRMEHDEITRTDEDMIRRIEDAEIENDMLSEEMDRRQRRRSNEW